MADTLSWLDNYFGVPQIEKDGNSVPKRTTLNFLGAEVVITDNPTTKKTEIRFDGVALLGNSGTGTLNDVVSTSGGLPAPAIRFTGAAPTVTGIASGTATNVRRLILIATGGPLVLNNDDAASAAGNRIITGTGANVTIANGAAALLVYDASSTRWRVIATGSGGNALAPTCCDVKAFGALGDGVTDDAPAFRAAMAAAKTAGHYRICVPETTSFYRLGSSFQSGRKIALFVNEPYKFIGRAGARTGTGKVVVKADAGLTAFACYEGKAAEGGSGARGFVIEGLDIRSAGAVTTVAYAASTAYTVGQYIKGNDPYLLTAGHPTYTGGSEHIWEVIKAGTTAAVPEASAYDEGNSHTPDRATTWSAGRTIGAGTIVRSSNNTHWDVFFIAQNSGTTHATTEPTWNYTLASTTNDNGITWECMTDPNILVLGTVIARVVAFCGVMAWCGGTIKDCYVKDFQNAQIMGEGNKSTPIIDSDALDFIVADTTVVTPLSGSGTKGIGVYLRGGGMTSARIVNCAAYGSAGASKGSTAMPTDGTQHNHGFLDRTFLGGNVFIGCTASEFAGYDFWLQGTAGDSCIIGGRSNLGRVRRDAASFAVGLLDAKDWGVLGGPNSYSSTSTSVQKNGLRNAYEVSQDGTKYAGLNDGTVFNYHYDLTDSGAMGWRIASGWNYYGWASTLLSPIAIANRQVATSANLPKGQEGGSLTLPHGFGTGAPTDSQHTFPNQAEYKGSFSYNERGGYRRVGDIVKRPDRVASTAYASDIVVTAGYIGPTWVANQAVNAKVAPPGSSAHLGTIVVPTSGGNLNAFECTTAGTTHATTEPNWASAPSVGNTVTDNGVVWTNVGTQPVLANLDYVGTLPGGGGAPTTAQYVTLALDGSLSAERVLTAGTNMSIVDGGANGNVTVNCTGTFLTTAGNNDEVQTKNGSALAAGTNVFARSGRLTIGSGTEPSAGLFRVAKPASNTTIIGGINSANTSADILAQTTLNTVQFGDVSVWDINVYGFSVNIKSASQPGQLLGGSAAAMTWDSNHVSFAKPRHGSSTPYAGDGLGTIALGSYTEPGGTTVAAAVYSRRMIDVTGTGGGSGGWTLTFPAPATADESYEKIIYNNAGLTMTISIGSGTTDSIPSGSRYQFVFTPSGVFRVT